MLIKHLTACTFIALAASANAANLPAGFSEFAITGSHLIREGTTMEFSPDGKLFVLEQEGTIEVYSGAGATAWTRVQANFFRDTPLHVDSTDQRGLLGIAFDPNYAVNRFVYVYYTSRNEVARNRIVRYRANANGDLAVAGSATPIMILEPLLLTNNNGGTMHFGPGGRLYVAVGDDGNGGNSQSIDTRQGKILRLNPDPADPIPDNNPPLIDGLGGPTIGSDRAIWCAGLRNPNFVFKPGTNIMYINDLGELAWEEVNVGRAGANYGSSTTEGPFYVPAFPTFTRAIIYYQHDDPSLSVPPDAGFVGQAITGGAFYVTANPTFPASYQDDYFFADYFGGWIRRYDTHDRTVRLFASGIGGPMSLLVGSDGALYYLARDAEEPGRGRVFRVQRD